MKRLEIKNKICKWQRSFIRDEWSNLTNCAWNKFAKEQILKLKQKLKD